MTKTTLKALWVGGGGVLATWLAVAPEQPIAPSATPVSRPPAVSEETAATLNAQADKLRARAHAVELSVSTRNPFRFGNARTSASTPREAQPLRSASPVMPPPLPPPLTLSGIAQENIAAGVQRTAVISADGQIYLVKEGDSVAGLYTVIQIEAEAVVLRDGGGADRRLVLP